MGISAIWINHDISQRGSAHFMGVKNLNLNPEGVLGLTWATNAVYHKPELIVLHKSQVKIETVCHITVGENYNIYRRETKKKIYLGPEYRVVPPFGARGTAKGSISDSAGPGTPELLEEFLNKPIYT